MTSDMANAFLDALDNDKQIEFICDCGWRGANVYKQILLAYMQSVETLSSDALEYVNDGVREWVEEAVCKL